MKSFQSIKKLKSKFPTEHSSNLIANQTISNFWDNLLTWYIIYTGWYIPLVIYDWFT